MTASEAQPVHQASQRAAKALHAAALRYDRGLLLREIAVRLIVVQAVLAVVGIVTGSTSALSLATGVLAAGALFVSLRVQQTAARQISELHDTIIALAGEGVWPGPTPDEPPRTPRRADSLLAQTFALFGCLTLTLSSGVGAAAMAFALSLPVAVVTTGLAVLSRSARAGAVAAAGPTQEGVSVRIERPELCGICGAPSSGVVVKADEGGVRGWATCSACAQQERTPPAP